QGNAALSAAVVVVEAAQESGRLSTGPAGRSPRPRARPALPAAPLRTPLPPPAAPGGRGPGHVLAPPGAPWDPGATGCNQLIRDGATLIRSLTDILEELGAAATSGATSAVQAWSGLDPPARAVLTALIDGPLVSLGRLAAATDLGPAALDAAPLDLELAGLVRRTAAGSQAVGPPRGAT